MTMPVTLSVVLPNYNHAKFVGRALSALIDQERPADEIIVVDDGSTDGSLGVIEQFAASVPSIKVLVNRENKGVIPELKARLGGGPRKNTFISRPQTIGSCPAFSVWRSAGLRKIRTWRFSAGKRFWSTVAAIDRLPCGPPCGQSCVRAASMPPSVQKLLRSTDNWILTGSAVFRRECVLWAGGFDERLGSFADGLLARKTALKFGFFFEPRIVATWVVSPRQRLAQDGP